jgi:hypothetical protein
MQNKQITTLLVVMVPIVCSKMECHLVESPGVKLAMEILLFAKKKNNIFFC